MVCNAKRPNFNFQNPTLIWCFVQKKQFDYWLSFHLLIPYSLLREFLTKKCLYHTLKKLKKIGNALQTNFFEKVNQKKSIYSSFCIVVAVDPPFDKFQVQTKNQIFKTKNYHNVMIELFSHKLNFVLQAFFGILEISALFCKLQMIKRRNQLYSQSISFVLLLEMLWNIPYYPLIIEIIILCISML